MEKKTFSGIEDYMKSLPALQYEKLRDLFLFIESLYPDATQKMSYNMPSFHLQGPLVYVAAYKNHIGFYPSSGPILAFEEALKPYKTSKGAVQFPLNEPFPLNLIKKMLRFRKKEMEEKQMVPKAKKTMTEI